MRECFEPATAQTMLKKMKRKNDETSHCIFPPILLTSISRHTIVDFSMIFYEICQRFQITRPKSKQIRSGSEFVRQPITLFTMF